MPATLVCVGKLREKFYKDGAMEYQKRLSRLLPTQIIEIADEPEPTTPSKKNNAIVLQKEGEKILKHLPAKAYVIALAIKGKRYTSEAFAQHLQSLLTSGQSQLVFVIGGSLGLSPAVMARADETLSFSDMTFPHQLARVMLLEQIYRGMKIGAGERYHK